jgi:hypothetical protein
MMRWLVLVLVGAALGAAQLQVAFEIVQKDAETVTGDQLMQAFRSLQLPVNGIKSMGLQALNVTLVRGECEAGYYWEDPLCLPCQCPAPLPSTAARVWFEPLLI